MVNDVKTVHIVQWTQAAHPSLTTHYNNETNKQANVSHSFVYGNHPCYKYHEQPIWPLICLKFSSVTTASLGIDFDMFVSIVEHYIN